MIYQQSGRSIPQKIVVQSLQTLLLAAGVWLTLSADGDRVRQWILVGCYFIVYGRLTLTMFHLLKRSMGWEEAVSVPFAFALYYIGYSLLGAGNQTPVGVIEFIGSALFVVGSVINTLSEVLRDRWKLDPGNQGRLYTGGLFRYSAHINYFGDLLWVLGIALITANPWSLLIPAGLFCFFAFYNAPMLDRHLESKYGDEFRAYSTDTAKIIPFIY